jgi:hypothetical protein
MDKPKYQPAFPINMLWHNELNHYNGMALRDYMAAKAMQGMLAGLLAYGHDIMWNEIAKDAYREADAMLKAREA